MAVGASVVAAGTVFAKLAGVVRFDVPTNRSSTATPTTWQASVDLDQQGAIARSVLLSWALSTRSGWHRAARAVLRRLDDDPAALLRDHDLGYRRAPQLTIRREPEAVSGKGNKLHSKMRRPDGRRWRLGRPSEQMFAILQPAVGSMYDTQCDDPALMQPMFSNAG